MIEDQPRPLPASTAFVVVPCRPAIALTVSPAWTVYVPAAGVGAAGAGAAPAVSVRT